MRRSDDIFGLPVFSIREGKQVGTVRDAVINRSKMKVTAFLVEDIAWYGPRILTFNLLQSLGQDALVIGSEDDLADLKDAARLGQLLDRDLKIIKKKVVTDTGKLMGDISGFQIDVESGKLSAVEIKQQGAQAKTKVVPIDKVLSIGPDVLVIGEKARQAPAPAPERPERKPVKVAPPKKAPAPPAGRQAKPAKVKVQEKVEEAVEAEEKKEEVPTPMGAGKEAEDTFWGELKEEERPPRFGETKTKEAVAEEKETGVRKVLEEKQDAFLIGRKATKDIMADDGGAIVKAGEEITPEVIEKAKKANKYLILSFSAK